MTPSERVKEIWAKLVQEDWVKFGGNRYTPEQWELFCRNDHSYMWRALFQYLDETQKLIVKI